MLFQAHLVPLDQGELADCYVTTTRARRRRRAGASCSRTPTRTSRSSRSSARRRARARCRRRTSAACSPRPIAHSGKVVVLSAIDNLWKGTSSQAVQNLNVMFGAARDGGPDMSASAAERVRRRATGPPQPFFHSRWVPAPRARARPRPGRRACRRAFARRASSCGIKPSGNPDLGLLVCDAEQPVSAARFTRQRHAGGAGARQPASAAAWTSCARCWRTPAARTPRRAGAASTTPPRRRARRRWRSGCDPAEVALASTGAISHHLPVDAMLQGHPRGAPAAQRRRRRAPSSRRSRRPTPREAREPRGGAAVGDRAPRAPSARAPG